MRPQQNRRMRGRSGSNNNGGQNRKGPNPLTRNYESNGPDVKIRGSAQQIAEKYAALARDAQSSGDRVIAENYLQHAEHYNRIIMAVQAQMPQQHVRETRDEDDADEDGDENVARAQQAEHPRQQSRHQEARHQERDDKREEKQAHDRDDGTGPQPEIEGFPVELTQEEAVLATPPAAPKTRTPRRRVVAQAEAAKVETADETELAEEAKPRRKAVDAASADETASSDSAQPEEEEAPRPVRRTRRPRLKAVEVEDPEGASVVPDKEIVTEAAQ